MPEVIVDPSAGWSSSSHDDDHVLEQSICRPDGKVRGAFPARTRLAIAGDASTDGASADAARPERELPGDTLLRLEQKGRGGTLRAECAFATACA
jgi:hypothetical protein